MTPLMETPLGRTVALAIVLGLAGVLAHYGLRRLERRLPVVLARRATRRGPPNPVAALAWQRPVALALLLPKALLWFGIAYLVSEQLPLLRELRAGLLAVIDMGLRAPLFHANERPYSAIDLLVLPLVLATVWIGASLVARLLRSQLARAWGMASGIQDSIATLVRYVLVFLGAIVLLPAWGVNVSTLAIFASVLGVGIGFGLQNIANNFVSGLLLNMERPIKPGDYLQVGQYLGTVQRIGARSTEIVTRDHVTVLVPNSRFLESEVVNWTHGSQMARLHVPVGVAYGSNLGTVRAALLEAARAQIGVLRDPRPVVEFRGFGPSSLDLELLVWTSDPAAQETLISELNFRIDASFRRDGIQIPFPQRDLHLRSPELDAVVEAWAGREFPGIELPARREPREVAPSFEPTEHSSPDEWSEEEVARVVGRMRGPDGLDIQDRRHLLTTYPRCFVGREALKWLCEREGLTRDEAVAFGRLLVTRGVLHHVLDEHGFEDGNLFYRFYADEKEQPGDGTSRRGA